MGHRIFLAGASGVVGRPLTALLVGAGHQVTGMGRSARSGDIVRSLGADYVVADVFDEKALARAIACARPDVIIHQLTDLPARLDPSQMGGAVARKARIREEGTRKLVQGAIAAGVRRMIAQSIAWAYAAGTPPYREEDPLDQKAEGNRAVTLRGIAALEELVLRSSPLHVEAAAYAAFRAVERWRPGIFNIAEPQSEAATGKAIDMLGWRADFRLEERKAS